MNKVYAIPPHSQSLSHFFTPELICPPPFTPELICPKCPAWIYGVGFVFARRPVPCIITLIIFIIIRIWRKASTSVPRRRCRFRFTTTARLEDFCFFTTSPCLRWKIRATPFTRVAAPIARRPSANLSTTSVLCSSIIICSSITICFTEAPLEAEIWTL